MTRKAKNLADEFLSGIFHKPRVDERELETQTRDKTTKLECGIVIRLQEQAMCSVIVGS